MYPWKSPADPYYPEIIHPLVYLQTIDLYKDMYTHTKPYVYIYISPHCLCTLWLLIMAKYPWKPRCPLSQYWYRSCLQVIGQLYIVSYYPWYILIDYIKVWSQSLLVGVAMYPWKFRCPLSQHWYIPCLQVIGIWYTVSYYPWVILTVYIKVWS